MPSRLFEKRLRQAISREQRRPQRPHVEPHGYCDDPVCAPCRAVDAWGVKPDTRPRPLCAVCISQHPPEDACPPEVRA
jgi:hypothetical protein